jgi:hypothetical protein
MRRSGILRQKLGKTQQDMPNTVDDKIENNYYDNVCHSYFQP